MSKTEKKAVKSEKPAKTEPTSSFEAVQKKYESLKEEKSKTYKLISGLRMRYKVAKGEKPADKAAKGQWDELHALHKEQKSRFEVLEAEMKALKPATSSRTKYTYPPNIDTPEKKKTYRAQQRSIASGVVPRVKKEKVEKVEKGKGKKSLKTAPVVEAKTSKKDKKKKKKNKGKKSED